MEQRKRDDIAEMRSASSLQLRSAANLIKKRKESKLQEIPSLDSNSLPSTKDPNTMIDKHSTSNSIPRVMPKPRRKTVSKKESLKFCRSLCKFIISLLGRESFSNKIFSYFEALMSNFLSHLDGIYKNKERFIAASKMVFYKIWKKHRQLLACTHNHKICLVTQAEWDSFFSNAGFANEITEASGGHQEVLEYVLFKEEISSEIFKNLFNKTLFILNTVFVNTIIYCELVKDEKFITRVPTYETFALMVAEPWLCKHYNHAKEKFALECCNKCKICRSGLIPPNFLEKLQEARGKHQTVKAFYQSISPVNVFDISEEQVSALFYFWGSQYAT